MDEQQESRLLDMNHDCLIDIFKHLDSDDILKMYRLNTRFHPVIEVVLSAEFKEIWIRHAHPRNMETIESVLRDFSIHIRNVGIENNRSILNVDRGIGIPFMEQLMHQYCNHGLVRSCQFQKFPISEQFVQQNEVLFTSLQTLILDRVAINNTTLLRILNCINGIETLRIYDQTRVNGQYITILSEIASLKMTKLTTLVNWSNVAAASLSAVPINTTVQQIKVTAKLLEFLHHFPNAKKVTLHIWTPPVEVITLSPMLTNLCRLKSFSLSMAIPHVEEVGTMLVELARANSLTVLKIHYNNIEPIENRTYTAYINSLCSMTNLKLLHLRTAWLLDRSLTNFARRIAARLKQLQRLYIMDDQLQSREAKDVLEMLREFVAHEPQLQILTVYLVVNKPSNELFEQFYDDLTAIRVSKKSQRHLFIKIAQPNYQKMLIKRNPGVTMYVDEDCKNIFNKV